VCGWAADEIERLNREIDSRDDLGVPRDYAELKASYATLRAKVLARFKGRDYDPNGPTVFAWHVHHEQLLEALTEPIACRVDHVLENKPSREIEIRLKWLRPVVSQLPAIYVKAQKTYNEAWRAHDKTWKAYIEARGTYAETTCSKARDEARKARDEAWRARAEARRTCDEKIVTIHAAECPGCPWNGKTLVFPSDVDPM
jgi:hypothetical protein